MHFEVRRVARTKTFNLVSMPSMQIISEHSDEMSAQKALADVKRASRDDKMIMDSLTPTQEFVDTTGSIGIEDADMMDEYGDM